MTVFTYSLKMPYSHHVIQQPPANKNCELIGHINTDALHLNSTWAITRVIYGYALRSYNQLQFQRQFEKAQNGGDDVTAVYSGKL